MITSTDACPCGSGSTFGDCCGALHAGRRAAATAEELMRSRYSAFAVGDVSYLLATHAGRTRPDDLALPAVEWTRLRIRDTAAGGPDDTEGVVEFRAHYRRDGEPHVLHERSRFVRDARGRWCYLDADEPADA